MKTFLTAFTGFRTRYYRSDDGKRSQNFLLGQISQIANSNKDLKIKIKEFPHPWGQNSILVRFEPTSKNASDEIVIIGAHQDSTNL
jgi:leucyl aminopeptidase